MVTSELKDGIVWLTVVGEMTPEDVKREASKWLSQPEEFVGFITDMRQMSPVPSMAVQKELDEWRKQNNSGKPHALLGRTTALDILAKIYVRAMGARDTRYFMDPEAAIDWVKNFQPR